jgi:hypothetical protein
VPRPASRLRVRDLTPFGPRHPAARRGETAPFPLPAVKPTSAVQSVAEKGWGRNTDMMLLYRAMISVPAGTTVNLAECLLDWSVLPNEY